MAGAEHKFVHKLLGALGRPDLVPLATQPPGPVQEPVRAFLYLSQGASAAGRQHSFTGYKEELDSKIITVQF